MALEATADHEERKQLMIDSDKASLAVNGKTLRMTTSHEQGKWFEIVPQIIV